MGEIQMILAENKAKKIMIEYDDSMEPQCLNFVLFVHDRPIQFRLTVKSELLLKAMENDSKVSKSNCTIDQARRTAWRNKKEWIHLQLTEIATGQAQIHEILLPYMVAEDGRTFFEHFEQHGTKLLG